MACTLCQVALRPRRAGQGTVGPSEDVDGRNGALALEPWP